MDHRGGGEGVAFEMPGGGNHRGTGCVRKLEADSWIVIDKGLRLEAGLASKGGA